MPKVLMRAPNGEEREVEPADVAHYKNLGATVVQKKGGLAGVLAATKGSPESAQRAARQMGPVFSRMVQDALPTIGAIGASIAVPPAAPLAFGLRTLAAGAGGAAGSAARDYSMGAPFDPAAAARSGVEQGAAQLGGEALASGAGALARGLMRSAIRPTQAMLQRSPSLVSDAIAARVPVRRAGTPPREALALRGESARKAERMVSRADRRGVRVPFNEMNSRLTQFRDQVAASDPTDARLKALDEFIAEFQAKWGPGASAGQANELKRSSQRTAQRVFRSERAGGTADDVTDVRARASAAIAKDVRESLGRQIPGLNEQNAATQRAIELVKAMARAGEIAPSRLDNLLRAGAGGGIGGSLGGIPGGLIGAGAASVGTSPQALSRYSLLFSDPLLQMILRQAPRGGLYASQALDGRD